MRGGSRTSSKWCLAMTARRSGFGMPLRLTLPSSASVTRHAHGARALDLEQAVALGVAALESA
jgi:hypothetical protein